MTVVVAVVAVNMRRYYDIVDEKEVEEGMKVYGEVAVLRGWAQQLWKMKMKVKLMLE